MIWLESPSNPLLKVIDIMAVVAITKKFNKEILVANIHNRNRQVQSQSQSQFHTLQVVVDNTFMTPYFQANIIFCVKC